MSTLTERERKLEIIFATHPDKKEVFMTSDDRAFFTDHQADAFAQGLADRTVTKYSRLATEVYLNVKKKVKATQHLQEGVKEPIAETEASLAATPVAPVLSLTAEGDGSGQSLEELTEETDATQEKTAEGDATAEAGTEGESEEGTGEKSPAEESKAEEASKQSNAADEKAAVIAQFVEVFGKKPSNFMKVETMQAKIAEASTSLSPGALAAK